MCHRISSKHLALMSGILTKSYDKKVFDVILSAIIFVITTCLLKNVLINNYLRDLGCP